MTYELFFGLQMVISRPKMTFVGQFAPPCASTRRGLCDGVGEKICPQHSIFLKNQISPRPLGEVGVKILSTFKLIAVLNLVQLNFQLSTGTNKFST